MNEIEISRLNYDSEGYHLADLIRVWLKETYPNLEIDKDTNSKLTLESGFEKYEWLLFAITVSQATLTPNVEISVIRQPDGKSFYHHRYKIHADKIVDVENDNTNYAYDHKFLNKFKAEIDHVLSGTWFSDEE